MVTIAGITGEQYTPRTPGYEQRSTQYATTSFTTPERFTPALIVYPKNKAEISKVLQYARTQKVAVALRTGGHHYAGASSTAAPNIQLDISKTFRHPTNDLKFYEKDGEAFLFSSVSWSLENMSEFLRSNEAFVPHGMCVGVHLGGHVQSGGYGTLSRSFGLLSDHVSAVFALSEFPLILLGLLDRHD